MHTYVHTYVCKNLWVQYKVAYVRVIKPTWTYTYVLQCNLCLCICVRIKNICCRREVSYSLDVHHLQTVLPFSDFPTKSVNCFNYKKFYLRRLSLKKLVITEQYFVTAKHHHVLTTLFNLRSFVNWFSTDFLLKLIYIYDKKLSLI